MGRLKKKGEEGNATKYITRSGAVKRLQVSLKAFRRLCILKGIYPREPPAAAARAHGRDKTYYLLKDIRYLAHDPLVNQLRLEKIHRRREARAKGRGDSRKAIAALRKARPRLSLEHIIRERYPTFNDAVRELDDVLCMVALFAEIAAAGKLQPSRVATCKRLLAEFEEYVVASGSLEKVFFSVKGIYFEARISGERVRWQAPLTFAPRVPNDVDLRVMLSFLELYTTLLAFVNFKLYHTIGLAYPPKLDELRAAPAASGRLFSGLNFYFSRETPNAPLTFVCRAFGGQVTSGEANEADESITHHISERPVLKRRFLSREYVVPQWLADSANNGVQLPVEEYTPDKTPPPHLSPFVDDAAEGYVPERAEQIKGLVARLKRTEAPLSSAERRESETNAAVEDAEEAEARALQEVQAREEGHMADLQAEQSGKKTSKKGKKKANQLPVVVDEEEQPAAEEEAAEGEANDEGAGEYDIEASEESSPEAKSNKPVKGDADTLRAIMLPKKKRRLYERVQHSIAQKKAAGDALLRKRQTLRSSGGM